MDNKFALDMVSIQRAAAVNSIMKCNVMTEKFGLSLSAEQAKALAEAREKTLNETSRFEFGESVLPKLISAFCDSDFIDADSYCETLMRLQEIFYMYKNETLEQVSDDELIAFMRKQYDEVCFGDIDYLEGTCLDRFSSAVRSGADGFSQSDEAVRWDRNLYWRKLKDMF